MFSRRSQFEQRQNPLWKLLELQRKKGKKIIDLTESNPTHCRFKYPSYLLKGLSRKQNLFYEPDPRGRLEARKEILQYYFQQGVKLNPDQIFITASTSEAYQFIFRLLFNVGDHLLVPTPGYPLMDSLSRLNDIVIDSFALDYDGFQWKIDFHSLERNLHAKTRAILIVHPNNPTGSYAGREDQNRLISLARKRHLPVIADEVFIDYHYPGGERLPRSFSTSAQTLTFTLNGLSKMVCLPQMKVSWMVITGPSREVKEAMRRLEIIADTFLSVNTPVQNGLGLFMGSRTEIQSQVIQRTLKNRKILFQELENLPECDCLKSEGGWYITLTLPRIMTDEEWALILLKKEGVLVYPGHFFDFPMEACLILSLLPPEPLFREGIVKIMNRISKELE